MKMSVRSKKTFGFLVNYMYIDVHSAYKQYCFKNDEIMVI